ncbi:MAG: DUF6349 family protein [Ilumatobacteraceae bacterium]
MYTGDELTNVRWISMGAHTGQPRRLARGLRAMCRPVAEHWQGDFTDRDTTTVDLSAWLIGVDRPAGDVVTWVPGHDGTPGPGAELAALLSTAWSIPTMPLVERHTPIRSAHTADSRPDHLEQQRTLTAVTGHANVIVVDNAVGTGASMSATVAALEAAGHHVTAIVTVTRPVTSDDRKHRGVCGICHAEENVDCTGTSNNHYGRAWRLGITAPGNDLGCGRRDTLTPDGGVCRPTVEQNYLWDHTRRDARFGGESKRVAIMYRGACLGCGWAGTAHADDENAAVEDAHDHSWPGWRELPIVPRRPDDTKAQDKWRTQLTTIYRACGLDVDHWLAPDAPFRTARVRCGTRSHSTHRGGYDICGSVTDRDDNRPAREVLGSEEQLALW